MVRVLFVIFTILARILKLAICCRKQNKTLSRVITRFSLSLDTTFGRGVYFSRDASYSCRRTYSPPDPQGLRYMYYATVLVGDYTAGERDIIEPPSKSSSDPNDTYDSVVDNVTNPEIYVLFQDYEYYPEYLITFR